jgi:hypothetical protein
MAKYTFKHRDNFLPLVLKGTCCSDEKQGSYLRAVKKKHVNLMYRPT